MVSSKTKAIRFDINLKNIKDQSDKVRSRMDLISSIITDCDVDVYVDNDGIGFYEYWGYQGNDKGTDYLRLERSDEFILKYILEEGIPVGTSIEQLIEELVTDWVTITRTYTYGADERREGISSELVLKITEPEIDGNTFLCKATWKERE